MSTSDKSAILPHVIFYSAVAAIGGFLFGFDSAVINGTVDALGEAFSSTTVGKGFSVASMLLGCAVGALAAGTLADRFGRRPVMLLSAVAFLISALGSGWASTSEQFIVFRLLGGLAVGAASVISPAYIAEIAPPHIRGRLASLQQLAIVLGIFIALLSNYGIASAAGSAMADWLGGQAAWKWMFWAECVPALLYGVVLLFIPESPRFLVARQREDEAGQVLTKVSGPEEVSGLIAEIKESLHGERKPRLRDLLAPGSPNLQPIVWIGIILAALQQLSGINVIFYFGASLWQAAGFSESHSLLINVVTGAINITATIVAISLIDKVGRKPLLLTGAVLMALSLGTVALVFSGASLDADGKLILSDGAGLAALIGANLYVFGFGTTWGPCLWVLLGEMFNNRIRGGAIALASAVLWVTNFGISMTFLPFSKGIGLSGAYLIYTGFAVFSFFFVWKFISETKGKTLESM